MSDPYIRVAGPEDAPALLEIYTYYVRHTAITFEYDVPSPEEFTARVRSTLQKYPYLAAVENGVIVGYAYAGAFHPRAAYGWTAEASIYLAHGCRHQGLGKRLYHALEECLKMQGVLNLNACVAVPEQEDEYLTRNSLGFHTHLGFRPVGSFTRCGYKFGRWYNMVWLEKLMGEHPASPAKTQHRRSYAPPVQNSIQLFSFSEFSAVSGASSPNTFRNASRSMVSCSSRYFATASSCGRCASRRS